MDYSYIFKLLSLPDDGSISIDIVKVVNNTKYIYILWALVPICYADSSWKIRSKDNNKRKIKHLVLQYITYIVFIIGQHKWIFTNRKT